MQKQIEKTANDILSKIKTQVDKDRYELLEVYVINLMNNLLAQHNEIIKEVQKNGTK